MANSTAPSSRNWLSSIGDDLLLPGQDDGADEGGGEEQADGLERHQVLGEERVADLTGALHRLPAELVVAPLVDEDVGEDAEQRQGDHEADVPGPVVDGRVLADGRPGEHGAEE